MNGDELRRLLQGASEPAWDDDVRASSALYAGRTLVRTRTLRHRAVGVAATGVLATGVLVALLPSASSPSTDVVLGCAHGTGTTGAGLVTGGVDGVTLSVSNPTSDVLAVSGGGTRVLALPGLSSVTLPLAAGTTEVRCGDGSPVRLTVQHLSEQRACASVDAAATAQVETGDVDDLTRDWLGALPAGAVVESSATAEPLRRVQVRAAGRVVAEAVWHAMPADASWQLESVSRCG